MPSAFFLNPETTAGAAPAALHQQDLRDKSQGQRPKDRGSQPSEGFPKRRVPARNPCLPAHKFPVHSVWSSGLPSPGRGSLLPPPASHSQLWMLDLHHLFMCLSSKPVLLRAGSMPRSPPLPPHWAQCPLPVRNRMANILIDKQWVTGQPSSNGTCSVKSLSSSQPLPPGCIPLNNVLGELFTPGPPLLAWETPDGRSP